MPTSVHGLVYIEVQKMNKVTAALVGSISRQNVQLPVAQLLILGDSGGEQAQAGVVQIISIPRGSNILLPLQPLVMIHISSAILLTMCQL